MTLDNLTLTELRDLATTLTTLDDVGAQLAAAGLDPVFDLTPGAKMRITTSARMPALRDDGDVVLTPLAAKIVMQAVAPEPPELADQLIDAFVPTPSTEAASDRSADAAPVDKPPADPPVPVGGEPESFVSVSSTVSEAVVEPEVSDGGQDAAPAPSVAPIPGSASALAAKALTVTPWTAEEDSRLIDLVMQGIVGLGLSKRHAIFAAARALGRPEQGAEFRCKTKLKDRVEASIAAARLKEEPTPSPEAEAGAPGQGDAAVGGHSPAEVQTLDGLMAHLAGMTDKGGWSLQRDTDLMELSIAGWPAGDIGLELQMQTSAIKPRFDALTGLHDDEATGKKVRRWTREQVLDGLKSLAKLRAA